MTIVVSYFCERKNNSDDKEATEHLEEFDLNTDEEYLHSSTDSIFTYRRAIRVDRLNDAEVSCARRERWKEVKMWAIIHEAMIYLIFLGLLCFLVYSNRNAAAFEQVQHLRSYLINSRNPERDLTKVRDGESPLLESFVNKIEFSCTKILLTRCSIRRISSLNFLFV